MITIGLGANLTAQGFTTPLEGLKGALQALGHIAGIDIQRISPWYRSAPVPCSDQPWYINGVAQLETQKPPEVLLQDLHAIEQQFGRIRSEKNAARVIDMDLLTYHDKIITKKERVEAKKLSVLLPIIPHPRLTERAFVLLPLRDLHPEWVHPATNRSLSSLIKELDPEQYIEPLCQD